MIKKYFYVVLLSIFVSIMINGCASSSAQTLIQNPKINDNTSIVLFGIEGKKKVQYLQFCANELPCKNYRFKPVTNKIFALRVPTPKTNFRFSVFAAGAAGYTNLGTPFGYTSVKSNSININKKGIYYYGILDTDLLIINQEKNMNFLKQAKYKYGNLLKDLKPINFSW